MKDAISHDLQASFNTVLIQWLKSRGYRIGLDDVNVDIEKEVEAARIFGEIEKPKETIPIEKGSSAYETGTHSSRIL